MILGYLDSLRKQHYKWLVLFSGALSIFGTAFDRGSSNVIIPEIAQHFSADLPTAQWIAISYLVVISALMLPLGRFSDIVGRKIVIVVGLFVFTLGGIICALSPEMFLLFVGRILQGFGGAMIQGTSMVLILDAFGQSQKGRSIGLVMIFVGLGNTTGPAIGGLITGILGWRAVFLVTSLITLASAFLAIIILKPASKRKATGAFDWLGALCFTNFLITLLASFTMVPSYGWTSVYTLPILGLSIVLLTAFITRSIKFDDPVLDLKNFCSPLFTTSIVAILLCF